MLNSCSHAKFKSTITKCFPVIIIVRFEGILTEMICIPNPILKPRQKSKPHDWRWIHLSSYLSENDSNFGYFIWIWQYSWHREVSYLFICTMGNLPFSWQAVPHTLQCISGVTSISSNLWKAELQTSKIPSKSKPQIRTIHSKTHCVKSGFVIG